MQVKEYEVKTTNPKTKEPPSVSHPPTKDQLHSMTTDELVRMLLSLELALPANAPVRQQIIIILQEREGNAFVERLLGKGPEKAP
ncbi:MAG: hypothetical protein AB3K77_13370 [Methanosarcinaceae archaeon]